MTLFKKLNDLIKKNPPDVLTAAALLLFTLCLRLPDIFTHYRDWDEAAMMSQAWAITQGQALYTDIFQIHAPLNILIFVPFFLLFSPDAAAHAIKIFNIAVIITGAIAVYRFTFRWLARESLAFTATLFFIFCFRLPWAQSSHGEFYLLIPLLFAANTLLLPGARTQREMALVGAVLSIGFFFKQTAIFDIAALGAVWTARQNIKEPLFRKNIAAAAAGAAGVCLLLALYFFTQGSLGAAIESVGMRPLLLYSRWEEQGASTRWSLLWHIISSIGRQMPLLAAATIAGAALALHPLRRIGRSRESIVLAGLLLWLACDIVGLAAIGRFYSHYLLQLIPALSLSAVYILKETHPRFLQTGIRTVIAFLLIFGLRDSAILLPTLNASGWETSAVTRARAAADYIRTHSVKTDRIFLYKVWDLDIHYLAQRQSHNGIYMFIDMIEKHTHDAKTQKKKRASFKENPPKFILVDPEGWLFPESESFFKDILKKGYTLEANVAGLEIYARK